MSGFSKRPRPTALSVNGNEMRTRVRFARWVFQIAGIFGLIVLTPQLFMEERIGLDDPPAITHPEFFYGFVGVAVAWQIAFLIIARDPLRYRPLMLAAVVEKASFAIATAVLYANGRLSPLVLTFGAIDGLLGMLFVIAFVRTATESGA